MPRLSIHQGRRKTFFFAPLFTAVPQHLHSRADDSPPWIPKCRILRASRRPEKSRPCLLCAASLPANDQWSRSDLNRRHLACKADALPTELHPRIFARMGVRRNRKYDDCHGTIITTAVKYTSGRTEFESGTSSLSATRSNQLSYAPPAAQGLSEPFCQGLVIGGGQPPVKPSDAELLVTGAICVLIVIGRRNVGRVTDFLLPWPTTTSKLVPCHVAATGVDCTSSHPPVAGAVNHVRALRRRSGQHASVAPRSSLSEQGRSVMTPRPPQMVHGRHCWLCSRMSTRGAAAAKPAVEEALKLKPIQSGIEYDQPDQTTAADCRLEPFSGWEDLRMGIAGRPGYSAATLPGHQRRQQGGPVVLFQERRRGVPRYRQQS